MRKALLAAVLSWLIVALAQAEDRADLEGTQILGSRELPKVLVIVPWKPPLPGDLVGRPVASLLDETLAPIDRDVFRRQIQYHSMTQGPTASGVPPAMTK
jgi:hypothetical protein